MLSKIRSRGLWYSIGIVFNKVVPAWIARARLFQVFRFTVPDQASSAAQYDDGIRFVWCDTDAQRQLAHQLTFYEPDDRSESHQACLAYDGDQPIGGVWLATDAFRESELGLVIQLKPQQTWLFAAHVAKSHRRRGIYGRMLRYVLRTKTDREVLASINPTNKASIAAHRAMIAETLGTSIAGRIMSIAGCVSCGKLKCERSLSFIPTRPTEIHLEAID